MLVNVGYMLQRFTSVMQFRLNEDVYRDTKKMQFEILISTPVTGNVKNGKILHFSILIGLSFNSMINIDYQCTAADLVDKMNNKRTVT